MAKQIRFKLKLTGERQAKRLESQEHLSFIKRCKEFDMPEHLADQIWRRIRNLKKKLARQQLEQKPHFRHFQ